MEKITRRFIILPVDEIVAEEAAIILTDLKKRGEMIGQADIINASTMKSRKISEIVSRNFQHFERIEGITVINWN